MPKSPASRSLATRAGLGLCLLMVILRPAMAEPTVVLTKQGVAHSGRILAVTVTTLTLRRANTGYSMIPLHEVDTVRMAIANGKPIEGRLVDWQDGVCTLLVGERLVAVKDDLIIQATSLAAQPGVPAAAAEAPRSADQQLPLLEAPDAPALEETGPPGPAPSRVTM